MARDSRLAAVCLLVFFALATPAAAGPPGTWSQVTNFNSVGTNTDEASLVRTGDGVLHILWIQDKSIINTRLAANAQSLLGSHNVFTYKDGAGESVLLPAPGGLRAFFSGLDPNTPHDTGLSTATSPDGITWTLQPGRASQSNPGGAESAVYAASGLGGTNFNNGTPLSVWGDSAPGQAGYHVGTSDNTPDVHFGGSSATVGAPEAATDSATGEIAVGWNDLDTGKTLVGMVQQTTTPWFPFGTPVSPPGADAPDALYPVGMTGRSGGAAGIYVAYLRGDNPFTSPTAIWRVGAATSTRVSKGEGRYPGVAMGPDGRLWAFWEDDNTARIHARRSNPAATAWGGDVAIRPPGSTTWSLKGEGSAASCGALDIVALASRGDDLANYHQRVLPGITLRKKLLNGNDGTKAKVRFTTLDAGQPVDATVKFGGSTAATGDDGKAKLNVERKRRTRKVKATATDECFTKGQVKVKVAKRPTK